MARTAKTFAETVARTVVQRTEEDRCARAGGRAVCSAGAHRRCRVVLCPCVCVSLTRCAAFAYRHCSWAAAEEEWEECRGDTPRPKPAAGRRVKQKGGWTEEEDARLARCVFGTQGGGGAAARA